MDKYLGIKAISQRAYHFLRDFRPEDYADGRYELGDGLYVNIESYDTKDRALACYESHKRYIDIQLLIRGREIIETAPIGDLAVSVPYDAQRDILFYSNTFRGTNNVLEPGSYLVLYPEDGHMPCLTAGKAERNRKAVVKIPVLEDTHRGEKYV